MVTSSTSEISNLVNHLTMFCFDDQFCTHLWYSNFCIEAISNLIRFFPNQNNGHFVTTSKPYRYTSNQFRPFSLSSPDKTTSKGASGISAHCERHDNKMNPQIIRQILGISFDISITTLNINKKSKQLQQIPDNNIWIVIF